MNPKTILLITAVILLVSCVASPRYPGNAFMLEPLAPSVPVQDEWIRDLERRVGGRLPADYVAFLRQSNGGWISNNHKVKSLEGPVLQGFFPVKTDRVNTDGIGDALSVHETLSDDRIPPWFVPIAETGRAAVYCISVRAEDAGSVYEVYEDDGQGGVPYEKRKYALIATSFTDFYRQVSENYTQ